MPVASSDICCSRAIRQDTRAPLMRCRGAHQRALRSGAGVIGGPPLTPTAPLNRARSWSRLARSGHPTYNRRDSRATAPRTCEGRTDTQSARMSHQSAQPTSLETRHEAVAVSDLRLHPRWPGASGAMSILCRAKRSLRPVEGRRNAVGPMGYGHTQPFDLTCLGRVRKAANPVNEVTSCGIIPRRSLTTS